MVMERNALLERDTLVAHRARLEHVVGFVQDKHLDFSQVEDPAFGNHLGASRSTSATGVGREPADEQTHVDHGTGSADDDLLRQLGHALGPRILSGEEAFHRRIFAHALDHLKDLHRELSRRRDTDGLGRYERSEPRASVIKDQQLTCGAFKSMSIRDSMVNANAAVLPVPDCDCPIMFRAL